MQSIFDTFIRWLLQHDRWECHRLVAHVGFYRLKRHHHRHKGHVMNPISTTVAVQAVVTVTDNGAVVSPGAVTWATSDPSIATVDPSGIVTPVAAGSVVITATCAVTVPSGGLTVVGTGTVTVTAVGDNLVATVDFQPVKP